VSAVLGTVNRLLTGLVGLGLLAVGGTVLAVGLGTPVPSWWIHDSRHDVLLSDAERTRWTGSAWWWPAVIAALAVTVLLALWWLTADLRRRRLAEILVDTGDGDGAVLRGRALENVMEAEATALEGVTHARVHLTGRRTAPGARVRLQLEPRVDPGTALAALTSGALTHAKTSAALTALPTEVRLRGVRHRAQRVG
jgi:hypothetical protein